MLMKRDIVVDRDGRALETQELRNDPSQTLFPGLNSTHISRASIGTKFAAMRVTCVPRGCSRAALVEND